MEFIIKYWLEFAFGIFGSIIVYLLKKFISKQKEQESKQQAIEHGVQALLRNELVRRYREYKSKQEISILDRENIDAMYKEYRNVGGNGTVKELMQELEEIPTKVIKY